MMRIVIDVRGLYREAMNQELRRYFINCISALSRQKPQVSIQLLTRGKAEDADWSGLPLGLVPAKPRWPGKFGSFLFNRYQFPILVRELDPSLLLTIGYPASRRVQIPQAAWIPYGNVYAEFNKPSRRAMPPGLHLLNASGKETDRMEGFEGFPEQNIIRVPLAYNENCPAPGWTEKENVKVKYAGGREYFFIRSFLPESALMNTLKAFSLFKKKQQSNMQLVVAGMRGEANHMPWEKLETYKYRKDVHVYPRLEEKEFNRLCAAAYAWLFPAEGFPGISSLNAAYAQVPAICCGPAWPEQMAPDAVLRTESLAVEGLAGQMILLFKDENLRMELIRKGIVQAASFSMQQSVTALWDGLCEILPAGREARQIPELPVRPL